MITRLLAYIVIDNLATSVNNSGTTQLQGTPLQ